MRRIGRVLWNLILSRTCNLLLIHAVMIGTTYCLSFGLRFEFPVPPEDRRSLIVTLPLIMAIPCVTFAWFHLYQEVWHYVSMRDLLRILKATTLSSIIFGLLVLALNGQA